MLDESWAAWLVSSDPWKPKNEHDDPPVCVVEAKVLQGTLEEVMEFYKKFNILRLKNPQFWMSIFRNRQPIEVGQTLIFESK